MSVAIGEEFIYQSPLLEDSEMIDSADVGYKDDLHAVHNKIDRLAEELRKPDSKDRGGKAAPIIAGVACLVAILSWLQPQFTAHRDEDLRKDIKIEVSDQLREPLSQLNHMQFQISEMQGELKRMSFKGLATSDQTTFAASLPDLRKLMSRPVSDISKGELAQLTQKLRQIPDSSPDYWPTVLQFIQFASATITPPSDVPPPDQRENLVGNVHCSGFAHCVVMSHAVVKLDGGSIPGSIFTNCRIRFTQNPVGLKGTQFINCVFEMPVTANPSPYLMESAKTLLASSSIDHVLFPSA
ncbi:MAG TPA: hypothetical protein VMT20_25185 [Terriglobia bacterium]|nr:hypothetical protein [Terriglobia bacterium]